MKISSSKSGAMVLSWKRLACPLWVGEESGGVQVPQIFFLSEGRMDRDIGRRMGAASAVHLSGFLMVRSEPNPKASLCLPVKSVPTLSHDHE